LKNEKLIAISTNGVSSMIECENKFVTLLKIDLSNLISAHCIAHREALATSDVLKKITYFYMSRK